MDGKRAGETRTLRALQARDHPQITEMSSSNWSAAVHALYEGRAEKMKACVSAVVWPECAELCCGGGRGLIMSLRVRIREGRAQPGALQGASAAHLPHQDKDMD